jgi:hypothetical protein
MLLFAIAVSPLFCCLGAVQLLGVAAAAIARLTEGTRHEACGQCLCLGALAAVGTCCGIAIPFGPHAAAGSAAALAVMTLITVADFSSRSE